MRKKVRRMLGSICAATVLLSSIPASEMVASASGESAPVNTGIEFYNASGTKIENAGHSLHGVQYVEHDELTGQSLYVRMPEEDAARISKEKTFTGDKEPSLFDKNGEWVNTVYSLARESAGGRIRFNTDSTTIKIEAQLYLHDFSHYGHGSSMKAAKYGFDVYVDTAEGSTYAGTVQGTPEVVKNDSDKVVDIASNVVNVEGEITFNSADSRDITIYFPITIETNSVKITVDDNSTVKEHVQGYEGEGRIVFYGSSITQGGAVTKPGNTYVNTVGRNLNMDYIDFGMWGRCKGEETFADYIASLGDVSAFVLDYDHNNSNVSGLSNHYAFYEAVREAYPDIPILILTRPGSGIDNSKAQDPDGGYSTAAEMKAAIRQTYNIAKANGDENVHFIDGESFFGYSKAYMADNAHPNDAGQAKMAEVVTAVFEQIDAGQKNLCVEPSNCEEVLVLSEDFGDAEAGTEKPTGWATSGTNTVDTGTMGVNADGEYLFEFLRKSGSSIFTLYPSGTYWGDGSNSAIEMDVTMYKNTYEDAAVYPMIGVKVGETPCSSTLPKYEIRLRPYENDYRVYLYDGTNGTNPSDYAAYEKVTDKSFADMYKAGEISFKLRIETEYVAKDGSINISVLVNGTHVAGFNLQPQTEEFDINHFRIFFYGTKTGAQHKMTLDNIKAYTLHTHTLASVEIPDATADGGVKTVYECGTCGKQFLDAKGIISAASNGLVVTKGCENVLFSDDFENEEQSKQDWAENRTNYATGDAEGTFGIIEENGNNVYQLLTTRTSSSADNSIYVKDSILSGYSDYTIATKAVLYQSTSWPILSVRLRNASSTGYEVQLQPTGSGYKISLRDRTSGKNVDKSTENNLIKDPTLAAQMATGKVSIDLRVEVKRFVAEDNSEQVAFTVYVGQNTPYSGTITLDNPAIKITRAFFYLYTGSTKNVTYKATLDDVKVYTTDYHTITPVDATPSTDTEAGLRAHYGCDVCGKKWSDPEGKQEITAEQLAYAKLTDIICQTKTNATNSQNEDIRFLVYIDDYTKYQSVTFKITCSAGTGTATCKDVYTGVYAGGKLYTTEDIYGAEGYFATFILKNNTQADLEDTMTVVATWKALDGTETTETRIVNISEERK